MNMRSFFADLKVNVPYYGFSQAGVSVSGEG